MPGARSPKPQRVHLPTGRVVELKARGDLRPRRRAPGGLLFSELTDLVASGDVAVVEQGQAAHTLFERHAGPQATEIQLFVEEGIPACDAGGTPLLGSYLPPAGSRDAPVGLAELAVYYRTFVATWTEDGPYDWKAELDETIAHELEHHDGWRVGHDPMDEEEQREIAVEHARAAGRKTVARAAARAFAADVAEFLARTWILWALIAAAILAVILSGGGGPPEGNPE